MRKSRFTEQQIAFALRQAETGAIMYKFKTWDVSSKVFAGYRYIYIDYDKNKLGINVSVKGPLVGVGLEF